MFNLFNDILMNNVPIVLKEKSSKSIRARSSLFVLVEDKFFDFHVRRDSGEHLIGFQTYMVGYAIFNEISINNISPLKKRKDSCSTQPHEVQKYPDQK